jgi:Clp amino terminal domain, pathogenicity island component
MLQRFNQDARTLVVHATEHARRLGHRYVAGAVMRAHGVTPELVEEEIVRRVGLGAGAGLFGGLDRDALATIGIDLDAVRARIEASFGPQALSNAAQAAHRDLRRRPGPRAPRLVRSWRRMSRARHGMVMAHAPAPRPPEATGRYHAPGLVSSGHIPFTPASKKILELTVREADARNDAQVGVEHVALALTALGSGLVPRSCPPRARRDRRSAPRSSTGTGRQADPEPVTPRGTGW